ncbi:MAG: RecQ family ATP-dependent DNA helicase [Spirochaetia bacterium]|nr:RecQ family ATP-dependent DNA helicase [Spirochaetia bacterium]
MIGKQRYLNETSISLLKSVFGFPFFFPEQKHAIEMILSGRDTAVVLPTGAGKSLIYQFPSLLYETGISLVISPLIALMNEQTAYLNQIGIPSMTANSSMDELEQRTVFSRAVTGKIKILFLSPEKALGAEFSSLISQIKINFIAVDEAHCISRWGHDFRPEYRRIASLRKKIPGQVPIAALTATATASVLDDISSSLKMTDPVIIKKSFYRKNLRFQSLVTETDSEKNEYLLNYLNHFYREKKLSGKIILYCSTRKKVDEICRLLKEHKFNAVHYHAGRSDGARSTAHQNFSEGRKQILVATNAFGMGLNEPDVRAIIHYNLPSSIEAYYQEAGRAGRDGKDSECILLYKKSDPSTHRFLAMKSSVDKNISAALLEKIEEYALSEQCRQKHLCGYFGEELKSCGNCDNCTGITEERKKRIFSRKKEIDENRKKYLYQFSDEELQTVLSLIGEASGLYGKSGIAKILRGEKIKGKNDPSLYQSYGKLKNIPAPSINALLDRWIQEKKLSVSGKKYPKIMIEGSLPQIKKRKKTTLTREITEKKDLVRLLKNYRDREARRLKWKKFMVIQNQVIQSIADELPVTHAELLRIRGLGESKATRFGQDIIDIVNHYIVQARR